MGIPRIPPHAKLFASVFTSQKNLLDEVKSKLVDSFGEIDLQSPVIDFTLGEDYYSDEMGRGLKRIFYSFAELLDQRRVVDAKLRTNEIEEEFARPDGSRRVNIDPGLVTPAKVILATTKNYSHRIYLDKGIFAEVTLAMVHGEWTDFKFTYPDYKTREYQDFFHLVRKELMKQT